MKDTSKTPFPSLHWEIHQRMAQQGESKLRAFVVVLLLEVRFLYHRAICKWKGHDWADDSWHGPDSGGIAHHCKRCGEQFRHVLY